MNCKMFSNILRPKAHFSTFMTLSWNSNGLFSIILLNQSVKCRYPDKVDIKKTIQSYLSRVIALIFFYFCSENNWPGDRDFFASCALIPNDTNLTIVQSCPNVPYSRMSTRISTGG